MADSDHFRNLEALRLLFHAGALKDARAVSNPLGSGWMLEFDAREGRDWRPVALERDRGGPRVFASLDTLNKTAQGVGFREFRVIRGAA
jgi:hypothetical protein